jgi:hypothetical protein
VGLGLHTDLPTFVPTLRELQVPGQCDTPQQLNNTTTVLQHNYTANLMTVKTPSILGNG